MKLEVRGLGARHATARSGAADALVDLSFRVEATSKDDETFTYITEDTFAFEAKAGKLSRVSASMDEDGSIADGTYDVRLKVKVSPQALK